MRHEYLPENGGFFVEDYLNAMRDVLQPRFARMGDGQVAGLLQNALESMTPMEQDAFANLSMQYAGENFLKDIGRIASKALPYVAPVAQIAAPAIGTIFGGPVGGMVGNQLAGMLTKAIPQSPQPAAPPAFRAMPPLPAPPPPPTPAAPVPNVNPAASQLMSLVANPQFLQSLLGQVLGSTGNSAAPVQQGNRTQSIPFGALMNTVSELALRASEEAIRTGSPESERYLLDEAGNYRLDDPASPEARADTVMELLQEDYEWRTSPDPEDEDDWAGDNEDAIAEWLESAGLMR